MKSTLPLLLAACVATFLARPLPAQPATGVITGRILSPATGEYVRNAEVTVAGGNLAAFSKEDGTYHITGVPAGTASITVSYTGYETATAAVDVPAGGLARRDFELAPATIRPGAKPAGPTPVVRLDQFVVSSDREGNAKAIMEQRAALNFKNVIASDNFGDITGGNIGEFIKYVPGVAIDYSQSDARSVRIGGLDPKYAGVSVDGMRMASAASAGFGADSRQFEFEQASINSVETIEVNKTLTARMDADSPAGAINLRSRSAFDRKGRDFTVQLTASANSYQMTLGKVASPTNLRRRVVRPGGNLSYGDVFLDGRLGVQLNLGSSTIYGEQQQVTNAYDYSQPARGPVITGITFKDAPKMIDRQSFGANLDLKVMPGLVFSLRTSGSHLADEFYARQFIFTANVAQIDPASTLTRVIARPTANANTRLDTAANHRKKLNDTVNYVAKLEHQRGDLGLTLGGGYSRSGTHYEDLREGFFQNLSMRVTRMGWMAERSDTNHTAWTMTQIAGRPWDDPASYGRDDANANNVASSARDGRSQVFTGHLDARTIVNPGLPIQLFAGLKTRLTTFGNTDGGAQRWTFVGPRGSQLDPSTVYLAETNHRWDPKQGGNAASLGLRFPDTNAMQALFRSNPEQFVPDTVGNFTNAFINPRSVQEQVDAAYAEANARWSALRFNLGFRHERTRTIGRTFDILPAAAVRAAGFTAGTIPYVIYQYRNGVRPSTYGGYANNFLSGGVKYLVTRNFTLQAAASQSIGRPNYNAIAGVIAVNETTQRVTLPNPDLKPETSDKFFLSAQYALEPAGTFSVSTYQLNVRNMGTLSAPVSAAEAGYADDPEYTGYTFFRNSNADGTRRIRGIDVEYSQQLVFLPGFLRGFSVFGSVSRTIPDVQIVDLVSKSANGGLRFSNHRFNSQLRFTWTAARPTSFTATRSQWERERLMFDFSGGWRLNRTYELTLSGRNILNEALSAYADAPGTIVYKDNFGAVWTFGIRGRF